MAMFNRYLYVYQGRVSKYAQKKNLIGVPLFFNPSFGIRMDLEYIPGHDGSLIHQNYQPKVGMQVTRIRDMIHMRTIKFNKIYNE